MNRGGIARSISKQFVISLSEAGRIVDFALNQIVQALRAGQRVYFRGFASFVKKIRPARKYRHPQTGKILGLPLRPYVDFAASPALLKSLGVIKKTARHAMRRGPPSRRKRN